MVPYVGSSADTMMNTPTAAKSPALRRLSSAGLSTRDIWLPSVVASTVTTQSAANAPKPTSNGLPVCATRPAVAS